MRVNKKRKEKDDEEIRITNDFTAWLSHSSYD